MSVHACLKDACFLSGGALTNEPFTSHVAVRERFEAKSSTMLLWAKSLCLWIIWGGGGGLEHGGCTHLRVLSLTPLP